MAGQSGHGRRSSTRGGARSGAYKGATGTGSTGAEGLREGAGKRAEAAARCTDRRGSGRAVLPRRLQQRAWRGLEAAAQRGRVAHGLFGQALKAPDWKLWKVRATFSICDSAIERCRVGEVGSPVLVRGTRRVTQML